MERTATTVWTLRVAGFVLAAGLIVGLEAFIVAAADGMGYRLIPRGLGWVALPVIAGIAGSRFTAAMRMDDIVRLFGSPTALKQCIAGIAGWALIVLTYVFMAEPFGSYMTDDEWMTVIKWIATPPAVAAVLFALYRWSSRKPPTA